MQNLIDLRRETGDLAPRALGRPKSPQTEVRRLAVVALVTAEPDLTRAQIIGRLGLGCSERTVSTLLIGSGFTLKKSRSGRPNRTGPT